MVAGHYRKKKKKGELEVVEGGDGEARCNV
jgi:hypothetical protein